MYVLERKEPKDRIIHDGDLYKKATNWKTFKQVQKDIGNNTAKFAIAVHSKKGCFYCL